MHGVYNPTRYLAHAIIPRRYQRQMPPLRETPGQILKAKYASTGTRRVAPFAVVYANMFAKSAKVPIPKQPILIPSRLRHDAAPMTLNHSSWVPALPLNSLSGPLIAGYFEHIPYLS